MRSSQTFLHEKPAVQARVILRATHNANTVNKEYSELNRRVFVSEKDTKLWSFTRVICKLLLSRTSFARNP